MTTPDRARGQAEEAERLAAIVSYGRDKERLLAQAAEWRRKADEMEAEPQAAPEHEVRNPIQTCMRALRARFG